MSQKGSDRSQSSQYNEELQMAKYTKTGLFWLKTLKMVKVKFNYVFFLFVFLEFVKYVSVGQVHNYW